MRHGLPKFALKPSITEFLTLDGNRRLKIVICHGLMNISFERYQRHFLTIWLCAIPRHLRSINLFPGESFAKPFWNECFVGVLG